MVFSSLFFLGFFLPIFFIVYYICPGVKAKNIVLLVFSLFFYAYGGLTYLALLILMSLIGWGMTIGIEKATTVKSKRAWLVLALVLYILNLGLFKYTGFIADTWNALTGSGLHLIELAMPIGISFYTFKLISYTVDVYRGDIKASQNFFFVLLYTSIFHHALQGPIVRMTDMSEDLVSRKITVEGLKEGVWRFTLGLGKKVLLADAMGELTTSFLPIGGDLAAVPVTGVWLGMLSFSLQLYLDFSGYSDMAIGLGRMAGFTYPENFRYPYVASSVKDFWRRWHISLSTFFRDYVYIPLGGNRCKPARLVINLIIVWLLTGLWHGAGWNFILWGLFYFVLLNLERWLKPEQRKGLRYAWYPITFLLVMFGWVIFRFTDFHELQCVIRGCFGQNGAGFYQHSIGVLAANNAFLIIFAALASTPLFAWLGKQYEEHYLSHHPHGNGAELLKVVLIIVVFVASVLAMAGSSFMPFLYEQF